MDDAQVLGCAVANRAELEPNLQTTGIGRPAYEPDAQSIPKRRDLNGFGSRASYPCRPISAPCE